MDIDRLERRDIEEKRSKCIICGFELTYLEYINDNRCVFHSKNTDYLSKMGVIAWLRFAWKEYWVAQRKLLMAKRGLNEIDFQACVGLQGQDIGEIKDVEGMNELCRQLKAYKAAKC